MKSIIMAVLFLAGAGRLSGRPAQNAGQILQGVGLVISEIMFDPKPSVGLPLYEYVEWYNTGADTLDLAGWQWVVGDKVRRLAGGRVTPGGYVIVCSPAAAPAFRSLGQVIAMESFPALRNTGEKLTLVNPSGTAVHTVEYLPDQFTDALKANGGWSLELADPLQYCSPTAWLTSTDPSGGTPGKANSQLMAMPPAKPPVLLRAAGYDEQRFVLLFSGILNPAVDVNNYACELMPGSIYAPAATPPEYGFPGLFFYLPEGLDQGLTYFIELHGTIDDCSGQSALLRPVALGYPSQPDSADAVITEVMFDPLPGQIEFVELFNRSERVIDLKELILARAGPDGAITGFSDQQPISYWLFPECYAVFTADGHVFKTGWPAADLAAAAERPDMPSLTNEKSRLILMDHNQKSLDVVVYSPDWHYPYLTETKGISLERLNTGVSGTDRSNWFSAPASVGGSTPGKKNSAMKETSSSTSQKFSLDPVVGFAAISPDPVQVVITYTFDNPGWFLRISIFNSSGLPVKEIFPFGMAPVDGFVCWDGLDAKQRSVPDGIYLAVADYYHPSGKRGGWKKACAIVRGY